MENNFAPVTAIIPFYNGSNFIDRAVNSILEQSYPVKELIIVNDGSTPNESQYLEKFKQSCKIMVQRNSGPSVARNIGIDAATTEWVAFLDQDDWWEKNKIKQQFEFIAANPETHAVHTAVKRIGENESDKPLIYRKKALTVSDFLSVGPCPSYNSSMVVRRLSLISIGLFNPYFWMSQDKELYLRVADKYGIQYVDSPLTVRKVHDANLSGNLLLVWTEAYTIMSMYQHLFNTDTEYRHVLNELHAEFALNALYQKNYKLCFQILIKAIYQESSLVKVCYLMVKKYFIEKRRNFFY